MEKWEVEDEDLHAFLASDDEEEEEEDDDK